MLILNVFLEILSSQHYHKEQKLLNSGTCVSDDSWHALPALLKSALRKLFIIFSCSWATQLIFYDRRLV